MTDEQLSLAVARALQLSLVDHAPIPTLRGSGEPFSPLADDQWAVPMMVWLVDHNADINIDNLRVEIIGETDFAFAFFSDHPTKSAVSSTSSSM